MKKKLLTAAVAAAMVAPTAAMAEAILYGKLHVSIDYVSVDNYYLGTLPRTRTTTDYDGWGVNLGGALKDRTGATHSNRIGVKGSEDLGNGLKAIYQVEFGIQLSQESTDGNIASGGNDERVTMRNSFVGLAGGWGTFLVGRHDTPMKISTGKLDLFADTMADYNFTVGFDDKRADNVVAYISPSMGGFQIAAASVPGGGSTAIGDSNVYSNDFAEGYSVAGIYSNGPFYASVAYESLGRQLFMDSFTTTVGNCQFGAPECDYVDDDYTKWRVGLGLLDWNGFTLTAVYEEQDGLIGGQTYSTTLPNGQPLYATAEKQKLWQIQAGYAFGNNMVKAMYGSGDRDGKLPTYEQSNTIDELRDSLEGDFYTWAIAFDHNFSKRTKAYVLYTQTDDDGVTASTSDWDGFSLGVIHSF